MFAFFDLNHIQFFFNLQKLYFVSLMSTEDPTYSACIYSLYLNCNSWASNEQVARLVLFLCARVGEVTNK